MTSDERKAAIEWLENDTRVLEKTLARFADSLHPEIVHARHPLKARTTIFRTLLRLATERHEQLERGPTLYQVENRYANGSWYPCETAEDLQEAREFLAEEIGNESPEDFRIVPLYASPAEPPEET